MGYIEDNLLPGEQVLYRAKLHWVAIASPAVVLVPCLLILIGMITAQGVDDSVRTVAAAGCAPIFVLVALVVFLLRLIRYHTSEFAVTNRRVLIKVGWLRRRSLELLLGKVEGIGVDQGIFGRLLGYGTITVTGTGGTKEPFQDIANPLAFRKEVQARIPV